jgi:Lrp/AsnC family transcriptional regulator, regulator for asnA, asnC and gidA
VKNKKRATARDELDQQIIGILQIDGRLSNADMARRVGISEATVRRRLERLTQDDLVKIMAVPNWEKMGYTTTALIGVQTAPGRSDEVGEVIARLAEAHYVARTTGSYDLFVWAGFASLEGLSDFLRSTMGVIEGVKRIETFVNLAIKKRTSGLL